MVRTIEGDIIVADDDGEVLTDRDDDRVDADDEGVEILTDGGTPTCEACERDDLVALPDDDNRGAFRCEWCGAFVDEDGRLPRCDDKRCPKCHGKVAYGILSDPREGIRGYLCVGECDERRIVRPEEDAPVVADGGRPPLSSFDHAPTVGPSDVDKCRECGRYAPHAFDHNPDCSRYESPREADADPARANPRMAAPATDGGAAGFVDRDDQSPAHNAANIAALSVGDTVDVWVVDDERKVVSGVVTSHGRRDDLTVVAFDTFESTPRRCALRFRGTTNDTDVEPVLFDPRAADTLTVRRVEDR